MATGTASPNYHGQLAASTVDTITMAQKWKTIQIINVDGNFRIDYTTDGTTPVVGGSATGRVLPAVPCVDVNGSQDTGTLVVIKLISNGAAFYSIIGGS